MTATLDRLAADARTASAAFHRARQDGAPEAVVEELLEETIYRYIYLGRALAVRDGLPVEHPFAAYSRARDHMIAEKLRAADADPTPERTPRMDVETTHPKATPETRNVYIAEIIWFEDNPVDGRKRIAVGTSLDAALNALRTDDIVGGDLVATEVESSALGTDGARTWAVHERDEEACEEGHLWITEEPLTIGETDQDQREGTPRE